MKKFIIGILLGGLLLSGGWFAWGAIQSETGQNLYNSLTGSWIKQGAITSTSGTANVGLSTTQGLAASAIVGKTGSGSLDYFPVMTCGVGTCDTLTFNNGNPGLLLTTAVQAGTRTTNTFNTVANRAFPDVSTIGPAAFDTGGGANWTHSQLWGINNEGALASHVFPLNLQDTNGDAIAVIDQTGGGKSLPLATSSYRYEFNGTTFDRVRHSFFQTTTGITSNAAGTAVNMTTTPMSKFTMIVDRTAGTTDAVAINLECSYDGTIWPGTTQALINVTTLAVEPTRNASVTGPCRYMRYNVVTVGAGNTLTIQLIATP